MATSADAPPPAKRQKLHGRAFYESIGSPKVVLAPMVDQSEFAWRMLTRSFLPSDSSKSLLSYTPMFHSRLFHSDPKYRRRMFEATRESSTLPSPSSSQSDSETPFLDGNTFDRPLTVQFCSNSPEDLLAAARHVQSHCDAVDLNLGCPQGIARKGHYGAFLQEDWALIHNLVNILHKELQIPVTAKMRILETKEKTLEYARVILDAGASILTVHGRRREQKGHITGVADWSVIRYLRENLPRETVLFANGNVLQAGDVEDCLRETGVDAVMSAEGNLCDPSIFADPLREEEERREYWRGKDGRGGWRMDAVLRRYLDIVYEFVLEVEPPTRRELFVVGDEIPSEECAIQVNGSGKRLLDGEADGTRNSEPPKKKQRHDKSSRNQVKSQSPNLLAMQPHLFHMLRPLVSKHTHVRDALAKARGGNIEAFEQVLHLTEVVIAEALVEYEKGNEDIAKHAEKPKKISTDQPEPPVIESSLETVQRCWRPWWVCQPYVRPLPAEAVAKGSITLSKKEKTKLENDASLAKDAGVAPAGSVRTVEPESKPKETVEVPKEGLVCG